MARNNKFAKTSPGDVPNQQKKPQPQQPKQQQQQAKQQPKQQPKQQAKPQQQPKQQQQQQQQQQNRSTRQNQKPQQQNQKQNVSANQNQKKTPQQQQKQQKQPQEKQNKKQSKEVFVPAAAVSDDGSSDSDDEPSPIMLPECVVAIENKLNVLAAERVAALARVGHEYETKRAVLFEERRAMLKKVDGFWAICVANHDEIGQHLSEFDYNVIENLDDLHVDHFEPGAFKITFSFSESNRKYFTNPELSAVVRSLPASLEASEIEEFLETVESCDKVDWVGNSNPVTSASNAAGPSCSHSAKRKNEYDGMFVHFAPDCDKQAAAAFFSLFALDLYPSAVEIFNLDENEDMVLDDEDSDLECNDHSDDDHEHGNDSSDDDDDDDDEDDDDEGSSDSDNTGSEDEDKKEE